MFRRRIPRCVFIVMAAGLTAGVSAFETDQFTLPPQPLEDLGPLLQMQVHETIVAVVDELNADIAKYRHKAMAADDEDDRQRYERQIDKLLAEDRIARAINDRLGQGWPEAKIEQWVKRADYTDDKSRYLYTIDYDESMFGSALLHKPLMLFGLSPTVNVYGHHMGVDKIGHFVQQGYDYYAVYYKAEQDGLPHDDALKRAVAKGIEQEKTIYGNWPTGVYSNADLAANYAGFQFLLNLTRPIQMGDRTLPPILLRSGRRWAFNPQRGSGYLRPFFSQHMNAAINPPLYEKPMRKTIREDVLKRRDVWLAYHDLTHEQEAIRTARMATWHGQDYGHRGADDLITPANTFFEYSAERLSRYEAE